MFDRFLDYVDVLHDDIDATEDYYGNPINAFTTISRFVKNWQLEIIDSVLHNGGDLQYHEKLNKTLKENELEMPTQQDLLETTSNVIEYQDVSQTSTEDLVDSVFFFDRAIQKNVTITASECYVLGRNLHVLKHYDSAAEWLLQARSLAFHEAETFPSVKQLDILKELAPSLMKLGNYKLARKLNTQILKAEPDNADALKNKPLLEGLLLLERINKLSLQDAQERIEENPELVESSS